MATIKTIQIAPYTKDCKVDGNKIIGTMDGRTFVFEIPKRYTIKEEQKPTLISSFREAIALCSKQWQVEDLLNDYWNIKGGKFGEV